jgi:hypothetical protein
MHTISSTPSEATSSGREADKANMRDLNALALFAAERKRLVGTVESAAAMAAHASLSVDISRPLGQ